VRFQTGTDENAFKNVLAAQQQGVSTRELVDRNAERFRALSAALFISNDDFIRTTEDRHRVGVNLFWKSLRQADVVQHDYKGLYCTGCEDFYLERDLVDGICPDHFVRPVEILEKNYFFKLDSYQSWLEQKLGSGKPEIIPDFRANEVASFVRRGLTEFSISRASARTRGWGTPVAGDESQTVYVWVDALINYLSALGYGSNENWRQWWNPDVEKIHVIGKNVWKFHAVYWPALLESAGLALPDKIVVHGFVTVEGQKIGKSLGNAVDPFALIDRFGAEAVRYYLLRAIPPFGDGDFSLARLEELYRTDLSNGIGNLVSRLATLCANAGFVSLPPVGTAELPAGFCEAVEVFEYDRALEALWEIVRALNREIERERPWELSGESGIAKASELFRSWLRRLWTFAIGLEPFLPETSRRVRERLYSGPAQKAPALFPRL
jgi:methionyl-tRNA synthetase